MTCTCRAPRSLFPPTSDIESFRHTLGKKLPWKKTEYKHQHGFLKLTCHKGGKTSGPVNAGAADWNIWKSTCDSNRDRTEPLGLGCLGDQRILARRSTGGPRSLADQGTPPGKAAGKLAPFGIKEHCQEGPADSPP